MACLISSRTVVIGETCLEIYHHIQLSSGTIRTGAKMKASVSDDQGLIEMLTYNIDYFKSKPADLPKTTILLDNGYHPDKLTQALEMIYPEIMTKIQFELSAKPSKAEKAANGQSGFVPVRSRWVIERSNAWVERCKSLVKNFDRTLKRSNAKLKLCFIRLMLKRLATA